MTSGNTHMQDEPTDRWSGEGASRSYAAPALPTLADFVRGHGRMTREEFLAAVEVPALVLNQATQGESTPSLVMTRTSTDGEEEARELHVAFLRKRPGSNSFSMMITLGRADNNDIVVKHTLISKFHAYFRTLGGSYTLVDAGSLNGTWIDGKRCAPERSYPLKSGAQLRFGEALVGEFMAPEELYALVRHTVDAGGA
ncbi:MAG: FHA domain-containing protein [Planctomycetota bacterium]|nr:MAG: FHA domain-containing protein [Planctomycetota bacterium]